MTTRSQSGPSIARLACWGPALAVLLLHLALLPGYGVFRDELYYLACARRLAWGYVDHPPLVAWIAWLVTRVFGESHLALRVVSALASAGTVWLAGGLAARFGGGAFARALAGLATGLAPIALGLASIYSMNPIDQLIWALLFTIVARALTGGPERLWLAFGAVAGLGLLNKISVLYLGFAVLVGVVLARRGDVLRSRWFWLGGALAIAIFVPHLWWQHTHGWPTLEFMANARRDKMADLSPLQFVLGAIAQTLPVAWLWLWGAGWLLFARAARPLRPLGIGFAVVLGVLAFAGGKAYYLAAAYSLVFAAGAVALERSVSGRAWRSLVLIVVVALSLVFAPLARPVLPVETYVRYAALLGQQPGSDERKQLGRLPQFYADMHGWREFAAGVSTVSKARLAPEERAGACIIAGNYGEAGALEYFNKTFPVISMHNAYWTWGPGACSGEVLVIVGGDRAQLEAVFTRVELAGETDCGDCMPYEDGVAIWIARGLKPRLAELWPTLKHFD
jgi:hypothetical protein